MSYAKNILYDIWQDLNHSQHLSPSEDSNCKQNLNLCHRQVSRFIIVSIHSQNSNFFWTMVPVLFEFEFWTELRVLHVVRILGLVLSQDSSNILNSIRSQDSNHSKDNLNYRPVSSHSSEASIHSQDLNYFRTMVPVLLVCRDMVMVSDLDMIRAIP